jgi:hypothetical protein
MKMLRAHQGRAHRVAATETAHGQHGSAMLKMKGF